MNQSKRVLVAPLNWGLGHATRCIPIIQDLISQNYEVLIASDGRALQLLKKEFPELVFLTLPSYNIKYSIGNMIFNIAWQMPKIMLAVIREFIVIRKIVKDYKIDIIISDNRFGCFSKISKNIFLTHQLNIKAPLKILEKPLRWINFFWIRKYHRCWIPDFPDFNHNLSGELSTTKKNLTNKDFFHFIGPLSRFKKKETQKKYDVIIILSGPEPQRTYLENTILNQIEEINLDFLVVQGKTEKLIQREINDHISIISFLTANDLNEAILASDLVISRSGYSTIMDLAKLEKPAILIPTPGQTEQEYLADRFQSKGIFYTQSQKSLNLKLALQKVKDYHGFKGLNTKGSQLKDHLNFL